MAMIHYFLDIFDLIDGLVGVYIYLSYEDRFEITTLGSNLGALAGWLALKNRFPATLPKFQNPRKMEKE